MKDKMIVAPNASRMIESLRDTGYEFNVAIADIIDNSIAAKATKVSINVYLDPTNEPKVYIVDNGQGMNFDELKNAMKYGSDSSENETHLNKFGFGLKTGSTAFCKKLSVLSKGSDGQYNKVTWDLDHISKVDDWELLVSDIDSNEVGLLEEVTNGETGTLVIWEKVDRLLKGNNKDTNKKTYKRLVESLQFHLSMVFQRFIDTSFNKKGLEIIINGTKLLPWDPFCLNEKATEVVIEKDQKVVLSNYEERTFKIKAVVLPRPEDWSTKEAKANAKVSNPFEGFYVYRENRLIHYGDWLDMFVSESHVSLLRVEFSFGHELDDLFNVDIKKSRILLNEEIYEYLKNNLLGSARKRAIEVYNSAQSRNAQDNAKQKGIHNVSNKTVESKKDDVISSAVEILNKATGEVKISNVNGESTGTLRILDIPQTTERRIVVKEKEDDSFLWETGLVNNEHAVILNSKHPFYYKVYAKAESSVVTTALDLLFWSLAESELATYTNDVKENYKDMRYQVSSKLKKLVEELPDPDINK